MIPDLKYPEDARKVVDSLLYGLAYDAATAVSGIALSKIPLPQNAPDFAVPIRCGGSAEDQAVRREAPILLSRFALISMVSRFDSSLQLLLLQRRFLEFLGGPGKKMDPKNTWRILAQVQRESRSGPVKMCSELVVTNPSAALAEKMPWLECLVRVRNCLAHRLGRVQLIDVKPPNLRLDQIDQTKDTDRLQAVWLRARLMVDGKEVALPYSNPKGANGKVEFVEYAREWKIGDQIDVDPAECQCIAITFQKLGVQLQSDFEREMNSFLGLGV